MAGIPSIVIKVAADTKQAIDDIKKLDSELGKGLPGSAKLAAGLESAFVPATVALGGLLALGGKLGSMAAEDAQGAAILEQALKNTTGATDAQVAAAEKWISKQGELLGVADDQLRPALASLSGVTNDVAEAQKLAGLAMDIAAAKGVPVETAAAAIAKAYDGQTTSLKRLIPGLDDTILKSGDFAAIQDEVASKVGGSAEALANAEGNTSRANIAWTEAQEALGEKLAPAMTNLTTIATNLATWVGNNSTLALVLAGVVGGLAAAIVVANGVLKVYNVIQGLMAINSARAAAGQWALNAAWLASPITWIIVGVVAIVAAIIYLWNTNEDFRKAVIDIWNKIKDALAAAWKWITETSAKVWDALVKFFTGIWDKIRDGAKAAWELVVSFFKDAPGTIRKVFEKAVQIFTNIGSAIVEGIKSGISNAWNALTNFIGDKVSGIVDGVKGFLGINSPSKVFMKIGEQMVQGLEVGLRGMDAVAATVNDSLDFQGTTFNPTFAGAAAFGGTQASNVTINVSGAVVDPEGAAREIKRILERSNLRVGF